MGFSDKGIFYQPLLNNSKLSVLFSGFPYKTHANYLSIILKN